MRSAAKLQGYFPNSMENNSNKSMDTPDPGVELPLSEPVINFPIWIQAQMSKAQPMASGKGIYVVCPVCDEVIWHDWRSLTALMRKLQEHLSSRPPSGLQFLAFKIGDRVHVNGESFVVHSGPFRPTLNAFGKEAHHNFYLKLERISDGKLFHTSWKHPGQLLKYSRQK